jgi:protein-S-isoprenylcysteine O-methyltransferase Ste14
MTDQIVFRILFVSAFLVFWMIRGYYVRKTRDSKAPRTRAERREAIKQEGWTGLALVVLAPVEIILIGLYFFDPVWMAWANLPLPETLQWLGFIVILISIPLVFWVHDTLGKYYSYAIETKIDHSIVKAGPYSQVRHPMYSVHTLFNLGMVFLTGNVPLIIIAIIGVPLVYKRMKTEKAAMIAKFGDAYIEYMSATGRIFPKIRRSLEKVET